MADWLRSSLVARVAWVAVDLVRAVAQPRGRMREVESRLEVAEARIAALEQRNDQLDRDALDRSSDES